VLPMPRCAAGVRRMGACITACRRCVCSSVRAAHFEIYHDKNRGSDWDSPTVLFISSSVLITKYAPLPGLPAPGRGSGHSGECGWPSDHLPLLAEFTLHELGPSNAAPPATCCQLAPRPLQPQQANGAHARWAPSHYGRRDWA
jgi:hypothetical protein